MIPVREEEAKGRPGAVPKLSTGVLLRVWRAVLGGAMRCGHAWAMLRCGAGPGVRSQGPRLEVLSCVATCCSINALITSIGYVINTIRRLLQCCHVDVRK